MRRVLLVIGLLAAGCGPAPVVEPSGVPSDLPTTLSPQTHSAPARGVVLFVVDTLRADRLGYDGYERKTSPYIDRLAGESSVWLDNYAQGVWTVPSMISIMTGLSIAERSEALPTGQPVLAELLSEHGIETAAFVGNKTLVGTRGFARGFDHFESPLDISDVAAGKDISAERWVAAFERWHAARADPTRPFFVWIHVFDPHAPYSAGANDRTAVGRAHTRLERDVLVPRWRQALDFVGQTNKGTRFEKLGLDSIQLALDDRLSYDGEVRAVDRAVEQLDTYLQTAGLAQDVLLVLAADHGEMLYEHRDLGGTLTSRIERNGGLPRGIADVFALGHTGYLYREAWRTPLLMRGPGIERGRRYEELSANLDIAPTVLEALGVDMAGLTDAPLEGSSKMQRQVPRTEVFGFDGYESRTIKVADGTQLILLDPARLALGKDPAARAVLLFDGTRPARVDDRAAAEPQLVEALRERIDAWRAASRLQANLDVDRRVEAEALKQLGYLDAR